MGGELDQMRREIDAIDEEIVRALGTRFAIVERVAQHKAAAEIPMMQGDRVREVKERWVVLAKRHSLDPAFVERVLDLVIAEACNMEDRRMREISGSAG